MANKDLKINIGLNNITEFQRDLDAVQRQLKQFGESSTKTFSDLTNHAKLLADSLAAISGAAQNLGKINIEQGHKDLLNRTISDKENKLSGEFSKLKDDFSKETKKLTSELKPAKDNKEDKTNTDLLKSIKDLTSKIDELAKSIPGGGGGGGTPPGGGGTPPGGGGTPPGGGGGFFEGFGGNLQKYILDKNKTAMQRHSDFAGLLEQTLPTHINMGMGIYRTLKEEFGKQERELKSAEVRTILRRDAVEAFQDLDPRRALLDYMPSYQYLGGVLPYTSYGSNVDLYDQGSLFYKFRKGERTDKALWKWATTGFGFLDGPKLEEAMRAEELPRLQAVDLTKYNEILKKLPNIAKEMLSPERNMQERMYGSKTVTKMIESAAAAGYTPEELRETDLMIGRYHGADAVSKSQLLRFAAKRYGGISQDVISMLASGTSDPDRAFLDYQRLLKTGGLGAAETAYGKEQAGAYFAGTAASYGFELRDPKSLMSSYISTLAGLQSTLGKEGELSDVERRLRNEEFAKQARTATERSDAAAQDPTNFMFRSQRVVLEQAGLTTFQASALASADLSKASTMSAAAKVMVQRGLAKNEEEAENLLRGRLQSMQSARAKGYANIAGKEASEQLAKAFNEVIPELNLTGEEFAVGASITGGVRDLRSIQAAATENKQRYQKLTLADGDGGLSGETPIELDKPTTKKGAEEGQAGELRVAAQALLSLNVTLPKVLSDKASESNKILQEELAKLIKDIGENQRMQGLDKELKASEEN